MESTRRAGQDRGTAVIGNAEGAATNQSTSAAREPDLIRAIVVQPRQAAHGQCELVGLLVQVDPAVNVATEHVRAELTGLAGGDKLHQLVLAAISRAATAAMPTRTRRNEVLNASGCFA